MMNGVTIIWWDWVRWCKGDGCNHKALHDVLQPIMLLQQTISQAPTPSLNYSHPRVAHLQPAWEMCSVVRCWIILATGWSAVFHTWPLHRYLPLCLAFSIFTVTLPPLSKRPFPIILSRFPSQSCLLPSCSPVNLPSSILKHPFLLNFAFLPSICPRTLFKRAPQIVMTEIIHETDVPSHTQPL